jgi:hypothetical protein
LFFAKQPNIGEITVYCLKNKQKKNKQTKKKTKQTNAKLQRQINENKRKAIFCVAFFSTIRPFEQAV